MRRSGTLGLGASLAAVLAACQDPASVRTPGAEAHASHAAALTSAPVSGAVQREIAELRALTAPFHRFETAVQAGWDAQITECFSHPELGGMGYHYGNPDYIDGRVDALEPELLLYEPQQNGRLRLVAVEYIVPLTAWTEPDPPTLYGQTFHRNDAFGIWALHVWHMRHNPSGMFADWNPEVTCAHAR